jgi:TldD protein
MRAIDAKIPRRRFLGVIGGAAAAGGAGLLLPSGPLTRWLTPEEARAASSAVFPIEEGTAAKVLAEAQARGAGFSELYLENRVVTRLQLTEGLIESVEQGIFAGCGVRAVDGDRTGYAYADSFEPEALLGAARDAAAIASGAAAGGETSFEVQTPPRTIRFTLPFDDVTQDQRVGWLVRADQAARAYDPAVTQVTIDHTDEMLRYLVINSDGLWVEDTLPLLYFRINVNAKKNGSDGTGLERLSQRRGAEQMDNDAAGRGAREAARMAVAMCEAEDAPAGEMPVVLAAGGGVLFHEAVGHGLEGDGIRKKTSFYTGKVGQKVASKRVSVYDTGAMPDLRGSYNIDDEGTPPRRNLLIDRGVLRGFLNDRITAGALEAEPTGNGRRQSYRFPPLVRMSNTFLQEGEDPVEEIIAQTKSGLYARTLGGGEVDTASGNFTFGVLEAYRIEDGKITAPVRGANLVGNGPEVMTKIDRVGPDQKFWSGTCGKGQWVPVSSGAPTLRISSMTVGGSEEG